MFSIKRLAIIGASGHGRVVADIALKNGYNEIVFYDDNIDLKSCGEFPVSGTCADAERWNDDIVVAIGDAMIRKRLQEHLRLMSKFFPVLVHPNAVIACDVAIGSGTVIMAGAIINPGSKIGEGCIVNSNALVDHDGRISDYVHVSCGAILAGTVSVGENTWIGAGAVVKNNVHITSDCMIGAGAVVVHDITKRGTYIGVPAQRVEIDIRNGFAGGVILLKSKYAADNDFVYRRAA